jgi:DNA repair protein RadC
MSEARSVLGLIAGRGPPGAEIRVRSPDEALRMSQLIGSEGPGFLLFLVDEQLRLLDAWRIPRDPSVARRYPIDLMLNLALRAKASGIIVVEDSCEADPIPSRANLELTALLRNALRETDTELLHHLLISGQSIRSAGDWYQSRQA